MHTIETRGLRKQYGSKLAVHDLSLAVEPGEVFGFLGPNGAGKTTSVKMLLGLVSPSGGQGWLLGKPIGDPGTRKSIGFLPEHFRFHGWLTGYEFLQLHAELFGRRRSEAEATIQRLLDRVGLAPHRDKKLKAYSKGMLQRIGLAQALVNDPKVVILDEPTSGLDPLGRRLVRDIVRDLSAAGTTVFINSHLLSEIEVTCRRVAFIREGEVIETITLSELLGKLQVEVTIGDHLPAQLDVVRERWPETTLSADRLVVQIAHQHEVPELNRLLVGQGIDVYDLSLQGQSLEEKFVQLMDGDSLL
jgi:ABC-2 type transport system ATP-binding protein